MTVFHRLNVAAIERETPDAVAITLRVPEELQNQYRYTPGQHLTLKALSTAKSCGVATPSAVHRRKACCRSA